MINQHRIKIAVSFLLVLIITVLPTAALLRADNSAKPMQTHDFTDVPVVGQEFMEPFINAFFHQGITGGCSTSPLMYCPGNNVTRGSMAVFMGRALGYVDAETAGYITRAYFKQTGSGYGVIGESASGLGMYGISQSSYGVFGTSSSGRGVHGASQTNVGVSGHSNNSTGVAGVSNNGFGVFAQSNNGSGLVAHGSANSDSDTIYDIVLGGDLGEIFGQSLHFFSDANYTIDLDNNTGGANVFIIRNDANSVVFEVNESGNMTASGVVRGFSGVEAYSVDSALIAISNVSTTDSATDVNHDIELGGTIGELFGSVLHLFSNRDFTFDLDNDDNTGNAGFFIRNGDNTNVFTIDESGNMTATGTKSAIVDTVSYGTRAMYAVESPENWFEDFGSAELVGGEAVITIDPMFAETVSLSEEYHVFTEPVGGWADLYIAEMTATSFTVRSADGSDVDFSYRIVAKRLGYEELRMEEVGD